MDPPDPIDAIKFRMEQQGLARKDLEALIGRPHARGGSPKPQAGSFYRDDSAAT
jgi:hypothetical protein